MDIFRAKLARLRSDDPAVRLFTRLTAIVSPERSATPYMIPDSDPVEWVLPPGTSKMHSFELAQELVRLDEIKSFSSAFDSAIGEYVKDVKLRLHASMLENGPARIDDYGYTFLMTTTSRAQADKEQGGTGNPELKKWLVDNGMPDVAEGTINANTLKSSISTWMTDHPIELTEPEGDEMRMIEGQELLDKLGLEDRPDPHDPERIWTQQEQYDARVAEHERLRSMVNISVDPNISMTAIK